VSLATVPFYELQRRLQDDGPDLALQVLRAPAREAVRRLFCQGAELKAKECADIECALPVLAVESFVGRPQAGGGGGPLAEEFPPQPVAVSGDQGVVQVEDA